MNEFIWHADADFETSQDSSPSLQCSACGRKFSQSNTYSTHMRSCRPQKKRMAGALDLAKENYRRKKARFNEPLAPQLPPLESDLEAIGRSTEVRASTDSIQYTFLNSDLHFQYIIQLIFRWDPVPSQVPLFQVPGNSRRSMALALLRRDGPVEAVGPRCLFKTYNQRCCAVCLLYSQCRRTTSLALFQSLKYSRARFYGS